MILVCAIVPSLVYASSSKALAENGSNADSNGFLYKIEKNKKVSYIFGTIHFGFSEDQIIGKNILNLVESSSAVYVEADISDTGRSEKSIDKFGFYHNGGKLINSIGKDYYDTYKSILVNRGKFFSLDEYSSARPWLVAMVVPIADALTDVYPLLKYGSEYQLIDVAKNKGIPLMELEGIEYQAAIFSDMDDEKESAYFSSYIKLLRDRVIYRRVADEINAWTKSDISALKDIMMSARERHDNYSDFYFEKIIDVRNAHFTKMISHLSEEKEGYFFALGCEHLVGPTGVLAQLSKLGFDVKKVSAP